MTSKHSSSPRLEVMPFQWFDKLRPGSIRGRKVCREPFCENFASIITHPINQAELKGLKQKSGESLRKLYRWFGELRAQVHDITKKEVIEAFSYGILTKWQFHDFYKENPQSNEEFKHTVEKMIVAVEKTRERFLDQNNKGNSDRQMATGNKTRSKDPRTM